MEACASRMLLRPIHQSFSRSRNSGGQFSFLNTNHLDCCSNNGLSVIRCGGKKTDTSVKLRSKETEKRLRFVKGLSKDLSLFSEMGFSRDDGSSSIEGNNMFLELSRILMEQQEKLKEEKKQLKRKEKQERKKAKALKKKSKNKDSSDSDSSDSDSSDNESEELVHVQGHREMDNTSIIETNPIAIAQETVNSKLESNAAVVKSFAERIDVCMGGKCKKFGAEALMNELDRKIGVEGAVVGCKCMGKCKNAPNVRVSSKSNKKSTEGKGLTNPLYLGVGLEDVDLIVSNFLGKDKEMEAAA
ncbi:hypothetical protein ACHQM5_026023 [Ranunculus cassubicifolius]